MPCYSPLEAWRQAGTKSLTFNVRERLRLDISPTSSSILIPCGQCIGCRLERARQWAIRCVHQARYSDHNYFLTLTFSDAFVPPDNSIRSFHLQDFWKRLRNAYKSETEFFDGDYKEVPKFKYYAAGEYGENYGRVHYHAAVFNFPLLDKRFFKKSGDFSLYTSKFLSRSWPWGHAYVGDLSFESAAYVARYIGKKVLGEHASDHYESLGIEPERAWISKGLGKQWYDDFAFESYRDDFIIVRGAKSRIPRSYDRWLEKLDPVKFDAVKKSREISFDDKEIIIENLFSGRHHVAELVKEAQLSAYRVDKHR